MRFYKFFSLILFLSPFLAGCFDTPDYPDKPEIEYDDISRDIVVAQATGGYKDSVVVSVKFKDGDGDLGLSQQEITDGAPYNFIVKQFRRVNGEYVEYEPLESLSGHFQVLSNDDEAGPLEGVIHYTGIQIYHTFYPYAKDTVKFEISIKDRAGNISNTISTDSVILRAI